MPRAKRQRPARSGKATFSSAAARWAFGWGALLECSSAAWSWGPRSAPRRTQRGGRPRRRHAARGGGEGGEASPWRRRTSAGGLAGSAAEGGEGGAGGTGPPTAAGQQGQPPQLKPPRQPPRPKEQARKTPDRLSRLQQLLRSSAARLGAGPQPPGSGKRRGAGCGGRTRTSLPSRQVLYGRGRLRFGDPELPALPPGRQAAPRFLRTAAGPRPGPGGAGADRSAWGAWRG